MGVEPCGALQGHPHSQSPGLTPLTPPWAAGDLGEPAGAISCLAAANLPLESVNH